MRVLVGVVLLVALAVGISSLGSSRAASRPGAPSVYRSIETSTSCGELQRMFDTAAANNDRQRAGSRLFKVTLDYMTVSDSRMETLGCYG